MKTRIRSFLIPPVSALWIALVVVAIPHRAHAEDAAVESAVVAASAPASLTRAAPPLHPEAVLIPVPNAGTSGGAVSMHAELFRPDGPGPFPVVIFSHGRAGSRAERARMKHPIQDWHAREWLARGVAVVAAVRVGYGETGGPDRELNGVKFDNLGHCTSKPDYLSVARALNDATLATLDWVRAQPWADASRVVLEGRSVGGFASVAAASARPAGVIGYINFSGGTGGSPEKAPGHSCDPDQLRDVLAEMGKTTVIPGLWLYAGNDQYWGPDAPRAWYAAFAAGGSPARFVGVEAVPGRDGHLLLSYGAPFWRKDVDSFVKSLGL